MKTSRLVGWVQPTILLRPASFNGGLHPSYGSPARGAEGSVAKWVSVAISAGVPRCDGCPRFRGPETMGPLRLLRNRKSLVCRELGPFPGCDAGDARPEYRTLSKGDGEWRVRSAECGVLSAERVYGVRMLEKRPKHFHFVPLFCAPWATFGRCGRLGKSWPHHGIGREVWAAGTSQGRVA
jgi:hypothetical protein